MKLFITYPIDWHKTVIYELTIIEDFMSAKIDTSFWIHVVSELNADVSAKFVSTYHKKFGVTEILDLTPNYRVFYPPEVYVKI
jgi:hypothetical protein